MSSISFGKELDELGRRETVNWIDPQIRRNLVVQAGVLRTPSHPWHLNMAIHDQRHINDL